MNKRITTPIRRIGGKGHMVMKLLPLVPEHNIYVEPFAGGLSLLLAKPQAPIEVINDLDKTLMDFYSMLRNPTLLEEFCRLLELTPYSRAELEHAIHTWKNAKGIERLRLWFVINRQGFGGRYNQGWSFTRTAQAIRQHNICTAIWRNAIDRLPLVAERLKLVQIDCIDACLCIERYDSKDTFFYLDPPYVASTRTHKAEYKHEFTDSDHSRLVSSLLNIKGKVLLSGYYTDLYLPLEQAGWRRIQYKVGAPVAPKANIHPIMTEVLWLNYQL